MIEEGAINGYELESITGNMFEGFTVTNKTAAQLRIVKIDQTGKALEGAGFSFKGGTINEEELKSAVPQGGTEAIIYENRSLPIETYTLSETDPPAGYNALPGDVTIEIKVDKGQIVAAASMNGEAIDPSKMSKDANGLWTLQVVNDAGVALPSTGGPGTRLFTILGLAMMMGAGMMLFRRRGMI